MTIRIGNLPDWARESDLEKLFAEYGRVVRVRLLIDRETGRSRGSALVEMSSQVEETTATEALKALNDTNWMGTDWMGEELTIDYIKPPEKRPRR